MRIWRQFEYKISHLQYQSDSNTFWEGPWVCELEMLLPSLKLPLRFSKSCCFSLAPPPPPSSLWSGLERRTGGRKDKDQELRLKKCTGNSNRIRKQRVSAAILRTKVYKRESVIHMQNALHSVQPDHSHVTPTGPPAWNWHYPTTPSSLEPAFSRCSIRLRTGVTPPLPFPHLFDCMETLFPRRHSLARMWDDTE